MSMCGAQTGWPRLSRRKLALRYRAPPDTACTNEPIRPAASGDSNSTGTSAVGTPRDGSRARGRCAAERPQENADGMMLACGDVEGGLHGLANGRGGEVGGAGVAPALAEVHAHAQRLVAVALDVLEFAQTHRHRKAHALGHLDAGIGGSKAAGMGQGVLDHLLEGLAGICKTGGGVGCGHGGQGKRGGRAAGAAGAGARRGNYDIGPSPDRRRPARPPPR